MDVNINKEMGEPNPTQKVPLDKLSKEDLVKKCKTLVALAQKAKQAKDDALKEVLQYKLSIKELEERCTVAEENCKKGSLQNEKLREQLEATQELLAAQQQLCNQTEALVDERVTALTASVKAENAELLSELNTMNQVLKQRGELISKMEACHSEFETQIKHLEANLSKSADSLKLKNSELESVVSVQREKIDDLEKQLVAASDSESSIKNVITFQTEKISELEGKIFSLETIIKDREGQIDTYKISMGETDTKIDELLSRLKLEIERREEVEKKLIELHAVVDERSRVIENLKLSQTDDEKLEDQVRALKAELVVLSRDKDDLETSLNQMNLKLSTTESELLETQKKLQDQLVASEDADRKREELEKNLAEIQKEKERSDCKLKEVLLEREQQLKKSQEGLDSLRKEMDGEAVELERTRERLQSEFQDRLEELMREKENLLRELHCSREEVQCGHELKVKYSELQDQFENLELDKEKLIQELECSKQRVEDVRSKLSEVENNAETLATENESLLKELESLKERLQLEVDTKLKLERKLEKLTETISALETSLANRDELLRSSEEAVTELTAQLDLNSKEDASMKAEVERTKALLAEAQSKLMKYQDESDGRIHTQLEEATSAVLALREELEKESDLVRDLQKRLEQAVTQGNETQRLLDQRTASLLEAEKELSRMRDPQGVSEVANTEVSSNLSMSRTEEAARLKDVEDSFEDKYTKLRFVAAKLKRRVNDLNQTLESERAKFGKDLAEQQEKVMLLTSQLKTTHTLQAECDRLQDKLDAQHTEMKELHKNLESAVTEAANAKLQLAETREAASKAAAERKKFEQECVELHARISELESTNSEVAVITRELRQMEKKLEQRKEETLKLTADVEAARADAKKKSVLSLEMADYEKSVADLTQQLTSERQRIKSLEEQIADQRKLSSQLQERLNKEEVQTKKLTEQLNSTKERLSSMESESEKKNAEMKDLSNRLETALAEVESLQLQCSELGAQLSREKVASRSQIDSLTNQVFKLEELYSQARERATISEEELSSVQAEYESYKVRAQSVLRQSARNQEDVHSTHSPRTTEEFEELEQELERLRLSLEVSRANVQTTIAQLQNAQQDLANEREDKARLSRTIKSLRDSLASATERQRAAEEALAITTDDLRQAKLNSDMLVQCYKQQLEDANASHQKALAVMSEELETLRSSVQDDRESPNAALLGPSTAVPTDTVTRMATIHREEGEGSESVDSYSARRSSVVSQDLRAEIVPLDKLLSSSLSDDHGNNHMTSFELAATREQLAACESRVAHLTALLSEVESDAARISQLNSVLKEEIRRQQRSNERTELAHNLEYLKNVVLKFITLQNEDERARLVPVLNTILKLSPDEVAALSSAAKGRESTASGWSSYLAGWSG